MSTKKSTKKSTAKSTAKSTKSAVKNITNTNSAPLQLTGNRLVDVHNERYANRSAVRTALQTLKKLPATDAVFNSPQVNEYPMVEVNYKGEFGGSDQYIAYFDMDGYLHIGCQVFDVATTKKIKTWANKVRKSSKSNVRSAKTTRKAATKIAA